MGCSLCLRSPNGIEIHLLEAEPKPEDIESVKKVMGDEIPIKLNKGGEDTLTRRRKHRPLMKEHDDIRR